MRSSLVSNLLTILYGTNNGDGRYPFGGFSLINATNNAVLRPLNDGDTIRINQMGQALTLRADLINNNVSTFLIKSVIFDMRNDGEVHGTMVRDDISPFTLGKASVPFLTEPGWNKTLTATALNLQGAELGRYSVIFNVVATLPRPPFFLFADPTADPSSEPSRAGTLASDTSSTLRQHQTMKVAAAATPFYYAGVAALADSPLWKALVNCGGPAYTDALGDLWEADSLHKYYNTGRSLTKSSLSIGNTQDPFLYQSLRYGITTTQPPLQYNIPVPRNGMYKVVLHFAEIYFNSAGRRSFDVWIERNLFKANMDVLAVAGFAQAISFETNVTVTDGALTIDFVARINNPMISAIAVYELPSVEAIDIRVNCGGNEYVDGSGKTWEADSLHQYCATGKTYSQALAIKGTTDATLYQSERYDDSSTEMIYNIPVPTGTYQVQLLFAELYFKAAGKRVFDVWVENTLLYSGLDIYGLVRQATALVLNSTAIVLDGALTIRFVSRVNNPKVSAIHVFGIPDSKVGVPPSAPPSAAPTMDPFQPVRINAGGNNYTDVFGNHWEGDDVHKYYVGGLVNFNPRRVYGGTQDPTLYKYRRYNSAANFSYVIPLPSTAGDYKISLFFTDVEYNVAGSRIFHIDMEGQRVFSSVDIAGQTGDRFKVLELNVVVSVADSLLNIDFVSLVGDPIVNAIQVLRNGPHNAHAVPGGPYSTVDVDGNGVQAVAVDGSQSHTHAFGQAITSWTWRADGTVVGSGQKTSLTLTVGRRNIDLTVVDSTGNTHTASTTATILPQGYPFISSLTPNSGDVIGGNNVTIRGFGFNFTANSTTVNFGSSPVKGSGLLIVNATTIVILNTPPFPLGVPVDVSVTTPIGTSVSVPYTYVAGTPIQFTSSTILTTIGGPASLAFGPDGKLYVGTVYGILYKVSFNVNFTVTNVIVSDIVNASEGGLPRAILGVAFDPMDRSPNPTVYVSHSTLFHGSCESFRGLGINGKISKVSGVNLTTIQNVITGLPVSDHDHACNGMEFNDNGDMYFQSGGNTNAGIPGALERCGLQDENVIGAATLVAHLSTPGFNGTLTYDNVTGALNPGSGIEVFATGLRHSYDIVLHSNLNFYATDNGPNPGYGAKSTSCTSQGPDPYEADKLVLVRKGRYYGHPNRPRAALNKVPYECVWRTYTAPSDSVYTAPMAMLDSSTNGIVEFHGEHFQGQLRYNLILGKYQGPLYRVILSANGTTVAYKPILLFQDGGLDLTQGPDGSLFTAQEDTGLVKIVRPVEPASAMLKVKTVFTRRGPVAGGYEFRVYGENLNVQGAPTVRVGANVCPVTAYGPQRILCTMPPGTAGTVDVTVTSGTQTSTMKSAFRYMTGKN